MGPLPVPEHLGGYVGGKWIVGGRPTFKVVDPATGEPLVEVTDGSAGVATDAVLAAHEALEAWATRPPAERSRLLSAVASAMAQRKEALARLLTAESGKPIAEARSEIQLSINFFE